METHHTAKQITPIITVSVSPNSSSFCPSGVFCSSLLASVTPFWILPISVSIPVRTTTAVPLPDVTMVPEKTTDRISCTGAPAAANPSSPGSFCTVTDSPVKDPSSTERVDVCKVNTRASADILSPTRKLITSPGTSSLASMPSIHWPSRSTVARLGCSFFSASKLPSADLDCQTPTAALRTRMARMTKGSTKDLSSPSPSSPALFISKYENTPLRAATARRI